MTYEITRRMLPGLFLACSSAAWLVTTGCDKKKAADDDEEAADDDEEEDEDDDDEPRKKKKKKKAAADDDDSGKDKKKASDDDNSKDDDKNAASDDKVVDAKTFTGEWQTAWGKVILKQTGTNVTGSYKGKFTGTITGEIVGGELKLAWVQTNGERGKATFTLAGDGGSFKGTWGSRGSHTNGGAWNGKRLKPVGI